MKYSQEKLQPPVNIVTPDSNVQEQLGLVSRMKSGKVKTLTIHKDKFPFFLYAGLASGFKVEEIAKEGEEFPVRSDGQDCLPHVFLLKVKGEGHIAVSIERPEGSDLSEGFSPFWEQLESLGEKSLAPFKIYTQSRTKS